MYTHRSNTRQSQNVMCNLLQLLCLWTCITLLHMCWYTAIMSFATSILVIVIDYTRCIYIISVLQIFVYFLVFLYCLATIRVVVDNIIMTTLVFMIFILFFVDVMTYLDKGMHKILYQISITCNKNILILLVAFHNTCNDANETTHGHDLQSHNIVVIYSVVINAT